MYRRFTFRKSEGIEYIRVLKENRDNENKLGCSGKTKKVLLMIFIKPQENLLLNKLNNG